MFAFQSDSSGTIWIISRITGIAVGLSSMTDYNLMRAFRDSDLPATTTAAQRTTIKNYMSQINPLPTVTTLNAAVLNLAQDNLNQTATLEAYISSH